MATKLNLDARIKQADAQHDLYLEEIFRAVRANEDPHYIEAVGALETSLWAEIVQMRKRRDRLDYLKEMKAEGRNPVAEEALAAYMAYYKKDGRRRNPQLRG